jgi:copper homeostasis protein
LKTEPSGMRYRNPSVGMGGTTLDREYTNTITDPTLIRATIAAARA